MNILDHFALAKIPVQLRLKGDPQIWGPGLLEIIDLANVGDPINATDAIDALKPIEIRVLAGPSDLDDTVGYRLTTKVAIQPGVPPDHDFTLYFEAADVLWISEGPKDADGKSPVTTFGAPARGQRSGLVIG